MKLKSHYLIKPDQKVKLSRLETSEDGGFRSQEAAAAVLVKHRETLAHLQELLYAGQQRAVLIVLQGMDTAGKDGTISHIFSGVNPQGCDVASFKVPTPLEARHDFLWRCHAMAPPKGMIGIFNRSHYEEVLSPRVHKLFSAKEARAKMDEINDFEEMLVNSGTVVLKFFLHISREEQTARLQARLDDPKKHWKLSAADFKEREFWPDYEQAYEDVLNRTSRKDAPWFVIPADKKWYRNLAISEILVEALKGLKLDYPTPTVDAAKIKL
ncbi:polyphosphate kinase 2 family protein [Granulicella sp. WH15]|uniref:polyphosphate kinase 2 family protein n=1 Tax=Granulicella sp. WH15 TaxID=2602070 RepID=UPI001366D5E9|nr:polyphosphate kinase 2 family protein [Granulicella sp. WH15]QHN04178.1 polyphosphate kinase 2 family protein [Granulicella sp. WH15]